MGTGHIEDADVRLALKYIRAHRAELLLEAEINPQALAKAAAEVSEMTLVPEAIALRLIEDELGAAPQPSRRGDLDTKTVPDVRAKCSESSS